MLNAIDQAWSRTPPSVVKSHRIELIMMYLSWDRSKNITVQKVKDYWKVNAGSGLNWESQPGAPLRGAGQGRDDAVEACRQAKALIKQLGYTVASLTTLYRRNGWLAANERISIVFSCDTDATPSKVRKYYVAAQAVCHANGFDCGVYGSYRVVKYLLSKKAVRVLWQAYAWSYGAVLKAAHLYQYSNSHTLGGASVDYDHIQHKVGLGALWPPHLRHDGTPAPAPHPSPHPAPKPPAKPKPAPKGPAGTYTVKRDDTLSKIAGAHKTTVAVLVKLNHLTNRDLIRIGQHLALPGGSKPKTPVKAKPKHRTYKVRRDDTLIKIADRYDIRGGYKKLATLNKIHNPYVIHVGETLRLS